MESRYTITTVLHVSLYLARNATNPRSASGSTLAHLSGHGVAGRLVRHDAAGLGVHVTTLA